MDEQHASSYRVPKRAYQACARCRQRKARCLVEEQAPGPASGSPVTCLRCKRERKECIFNLGLARRSSIRNRDNDSNHDGPVVQQAISPDANRARPPDAQSDPHANDDRIQPQLQPIDESLPGRVSRAVLSTQTDALNLLFEAAETYHASATQPEAQSDHQTNLAFASSQDETNPAQQPPEQVGSSAASRSPRNWLCHTNDPQPVALVDIFSRLKFVKKRWLTAEEALTYVQLFFKNMSPLSPILATWHGDLRNYYTMIAREPVLCTVILTLSSRYHILHGDGCVSRSHFLHNRLSTYCHSLLQRVVWGHEEEIVSSTRSLGTIEGLLLMTEWHPRSLHMPPDIEAWDSNDEDPERTTNTTIPVPSSRSTHVPTRWLQGVAQPLRRSDRMSWALIQTAASLAQELGILNDTSDDVSASMPAEPAVGQARQRKKRLRILLYLYINQLAFRIGYSPLIPNSLVTLTSTALHLTPGAQISDQWLKLILLWSELAALTRTSQVLIFASKAVTKEVIQSGRYRIIFEHFKPLFDTWMSKYSALHDKGPLEVFLLIDFSFFKTYLYSLVLQAAAERQQTATTLSFKIEDCQFVQEIVVNANNLLRSVIEFGNTGLLKYTPVRVYIRIISACIYLLKALSLGAPGDQFNASLDRIDECAKALRLHIVDDVHLAGIFASLLETYTSEFRERCVRMPSLPHPDVCEQPQHASQNDFLRGNSSQGEWHNGVEIETGDIMGDGTSGNQDPAHPSAYELLARPVDMYTVPFGFDLAQSLDVFNIDMDLVWS